MADFFFNALLGAAAARKSKFTLTLNITADNLQFGVTPRWNAGGGCEIEWGDGNSTVATTSGTTLRHTYAGPGVYIVAITGDIYRLGMVNPGAVTFCNGNWEALGNITDGTSMFNGCVNMDITVDHLPPSLTVGQAMFINCEAATLPLTSLPDGLTNCANMFQLCEASTMNIPKLPSGITNANYMFYRCRKMTANLDAWVTANPSGWASLTSVSNFARIAGSLNSPGTFTGSRSAFEAKCPLITDWTTPQPFYGTNTTE